MEKQTPGFEHLRQNVCTIALYGHDQPYFFRGTLVLRTYYTDTRTHKIDALRTSAYAMDTMFYETNKVIRSSHREPYSEARHLVTAPADMLGNPYRILYNRRALPGAMEDNSIVLLRSHDPEARGLAIVAKLQENGTLTWLREDEARQVQKVLSAMMNYEEE